MATVPFRPSARSASPGRGLALLRLIALGWLTAWLGLITLNNITDFGTNRSLIQQMYQMRPLLHDPVRGHGLVWRAFPGGLATPTLIGVIIYEALIVALLARALPDAVRLYRHGGDPRPFLTRANRGLAAALGLPAFFLTGGMWFGYWLFMGPVQQVHLTLLIIVIVAAVLVNLPGPRPDEPESHRAARAGTGAAPGPIRGRAAAGP